MEDTLQQEGVVAENATVEQEIPSGDFRSQLPEDLRADPSLQNFKDINSLAKSYVNAQQMIGRSIRIPTEDAGPEQREEFYSKLKDIPGVARLPQNEGDKELFYKLGLPEEPSGYNIDIEGVVPGQLDPIYQKFHELNLTKAQAEGVIDMYLDSQNEYVEQNTMSRQQSEQILRSKWGPEYDTRMQAAKNVIQEYSKSYPTEINQLVNGPAGNNPAFIAMLSEMSQLHQEKGSPAFNNSVQFGTSSEEAMEKIAEIRGNPNHAFHNATDPDHAKAVDKVRRLYQIAYPSEG